MFKLVTQSNTTWNDIASLYFVSLTCDVSPTYFTYLTYD